MWTAFIFGLSNLDSVARSKSPAVGTKGLAAGPRAHATARAAEGRRATAPRDLPAARHPTRGTAGTVRHTEKKYGHFS